MICLSLTAETMEAALAAVEANLGTIDMVELRLDLLAEEKEEAVRAFPERCDARTSAAGGSVLPKILTVRRASDGGRFADGEAERLALLRRGIGAGYDWVDLEIDLAESNEGRVLADAARTSGVRVIRSLHDTTGVPADLPHALESLASREGEIPKLAVTPGGIADLRRMAALAPEVRRLGGIIVGMGTVGIPFRILSPVLGSLLCYCSVGNRRAAPGHLDPRTLTELYGYHRLTPRTRVFGVIGNPVMHSKSPMFHNRLFADRALDAVYVPFHVDSVHEFFLLAEELSIGGVSVTIPHKGDVIAELDEVDPSVSATGACNTVVRIADGRRRGVNTDVSGFLRPLQALRELDGAGAAVIGAGGAARAVAYALASAGARVCILNRTAERARALVADLNENHRFHALTAGPLDERSEALIRDHSDIIVQTTSVGMAPNEEADPLPWYTFSGSELVYDIIYVPEVTRFLQRARIAGCTCVGGMEMFRGQAEEQSRLFCDAIESG